MAATAGEAGIAAVSGSALVALCDLGVPWNSAREIVQAAGRANGPGTFVDRIRDQLHDRQDVERAWVQSVPTPAQPQLATVYANLERLLHSRADG
jgi:hypothetical protein